MKNITIKDSLNGLQVVVGLGIKIGILFIIGGEVAVSQLIYYVNLLPRGRQKMLKKAVILAIGHNIWYRRIEILSHRFLTFVKIPGKDLKINVKNFSINFYE